MSQLLNQGVAMDTTVKKKITGIANQTEIAKRMGYTPQTVSLWFKNDVPLKNIRRLCDVLNWRVTPHEINPLIYPNPTDGLPDKSEHNSQGT